MARSYPGGTGMYCPKCDAIRTCTAISAGKENKVQTRYYTENPDINFFRRKRECQECSYVFDTGEISLSFLQELTELRTEIEKRRRELDDQKLLNEAAADALETRSSTLFKERRKLKAMISSIQDIIEAQEK